MRAGEPLYVIGTGRTTRHRVEMPKDERDVTPPLMAEWLVEVARECVR